jgi:hypothetical protein
MVSRAWSAPAEINCAAEFYIAACSRQMGTVVMSNGRISVGPKKTLGELDAETGRLLPEPGVAGQPAQEFDQQHDVNHWKYHRHLDPYWDSMGRAAR